MKRIVTFFVAALSLSLTFCFANDQGYITLTHSELQRIKLSSEDDPYVLLGEKQTHIFSILGLQRTQLAKSEKLLACVQSVCNSERIIKHSMFVAACEQALFYLAEKAERTRNLVDMICDIAEQCQKLILFEVDCSNETQRALFVADGFDNVWMARVADRAPVPPVGELTSHTVLAQMARPPKDLVFNGRLNVNKILADAVIPLGTKEVGPTVMITGDVAVSECAQFMSADIAGTHHIGAVPIPGTFPAQGSASSGIRFNFVPNLKTGVYIRVLVLTNKGDTDSGFAAVDLFAQPAGGTAGVAIDAFSPDGVPLIASTVSESTIDFYLSYTAAHKDALFVYKVVGPNLESVVPRVGVGPVL